MNYSKLLQHPIIAIVIQLIVAMITSDWWKGALAGSFYFIGREYAQAENRNIDANYNHNRASMPFWGGLQLRAWTVEGVVDFALPSITVSLIAFTINKIVK